MINLEIINEKSIVILSSPRTGSTLLAKYLEKKLGYKLFSEPSQDTKNLNEFFRWYELKQKFILKEHTSLFFRSYPKQILDDVFIIRITRNNILEQTLSNYIAVMRNKFIYTDKIEIDQIIGDKEKLLANYDYIKNHNEITNSIKYKIDLEIVYEDLEINEDIGLIPTPKPINYYDLKSWASSVLKDKL